jgi:hypothetical protein
MSVGQNIKTSLFANFQGGSLVVADLNLFPGNCFFVNSTTTAGSDTAGFGRSPLAPWKTLKFALTQVADADTIFLGPGHTEVITAAAGVNVTKAGVHIIGTSCGGQAKSIISFSGSAAASFDINGANTCLQNLYFTAVDAVGALSLTGAMLNVKAGGARINNCIFVQANATIQAALALNCTSTFMLLEKCLFYGTSDGPCTAAVRLTAATNTVIESNYMLGAYGLAVGAIQGLTTDSFSIAIVRNFINNYTAGSTKAITLLSLSSGIISDNRMQILSGTAPITGAAMSWVGGNYYSGTIATAGTLI